MIETLLEVLIFFTAATTVIQCIEMYILIQNQKQTNYILQHPIDMICRLADDLKDDKEAQQTFFELIAAMSITGFETIQNRVGKGIAKEIKEASNPLPKKYAWAWPLIQGFMPKKAIVEGAAEVVESWGPATL